MNGYDRNEASDQGAAARRARTVLIVDDHPGAAELLGKILALKGYEPVLAGDGHAAIDAAGRERPGVMLLDMTLPDISGHEICRHVRAQPWGREVLIIGISGRADESCDEEAAEAGCDYYLVKPVRFDALEMLILGGRSACEAGNGSCP